MPGGDGARLKRTVGLVALLVILIVVGWMLWDDGAADVEPALEDEGLDVVTETETAPSLAGSPKVKPPEPVEVPPTSPRSDTTPSVATQPEVSPADFRYVAPVCDPGFVTWDVNIRGRVAAFPASDASGATVRFVHTVDGKGLETFCDSLGRFHLTGKVVGPLMLKEFALLEVRTPRGNLGYRLVPPTTSGWLQIRLSRRDIIVGPTTRKHVLDVDAPVGGLPDIRAQLLYPFRGYFFEGPELDVRNGYAEFPRPAPFTHVLVTAPHAKGQVVALSEGATTEVELEPAAPRTLEVIDGATGKPVPNAVIRARAGKTASRSYKRLPLGLDVAATDAAGLTTLPGDPAGEFWVWVDGRVRNPDSRFSMKKIETIAGAPEHWRVVLAPRRTVTWPLEKMDRRDRPGYGRFSVDSCSGGDAPTPHVPPHLFVVDDHIVMHDAPSSAFRATIRSVGRFVTCEAPAASSSESLPVPKGLRQTAYRGRRSGFLPGWMFIEHREKYFPPTMLELGRDFAVGYIPRLGRDAWQVWPLQSTIAKGIAAPLPLPAFGDGSATPDLARLRRQLALGFDLVLTEEVIARLPPRWHVRVADHPAPFYMATSSNEDTDAQRVHLRIPVLAPPGDARNVVITLHSGFPFVPLTANRETTASTVARGVVRARPSKQRIEGWPEVTLEVTR